MIRTFEKIIEQKVTKRLDKLKETISAYHTEILSFDVKFTKRCETIEEILNYKANASEDDILKSTLDEYEEKIDKIAEKRLTSVNLKILKSGVMNRNRKLPN